MPLRNTSSMFYTRNMSNDKVRKRVLPPGWYPNNQKETEEKFEKWENGINTVQEQTGIAAIVPHAGWVFSGKLAYKTIRRINPECEVVLVVGGHLRAGDGVAVAEEQFFGTPLGPIQAADEYRNRLIDQLDIKADSVPDNTVEVQLPIVRYLFPRAEIVWLRVGAGEEAVNLGKVCAGISGSFSEKVCMIGSTDLTHYGPNYGFAPKGIGQESLKWAQQENDAGIIQQMLEMNSQEVLRWGNERKAACSAGAAVAAIEYASAYGCEEGVLVGYESSYSFNPDSSFVGYAGITYSNAER